LPVKFVVNPNFDKLKDLYAKSKFFWHAAGFGVDELAQPEKVEHFGITTVEAMSSGCLPVVIGKGGQKEIIVEGTGYLCDDAKEIASKTETLLGNDSLYKKSQAMAIDHAQKYSHSSFFSNQKKLL